MPAFAEKYAHEQREAVGFARVERNLKACEVVELAAKGALTFNGRPVEPFEIGENYVRSIGSRYKARRAGRITSDLAKVPPRDAIEALRVRLVSVADQELTALERSKVGERDMERHRQITRCVREAAALPGPKDPRPAAPGANTHGQENRVGGDTAGGLAGSILAAAGMGGRKHVDRR
jgi:hypothetical protein